MEEIKMRTYQSIGHFIKVIFETLKPPGLFWTLVSLDWNFREKIQQTFSIANNCYT
ncbi:MAG: hypothetical protein KJ737_27295 [Proteobacteria bacterium]|nr:hypothetical protein [Pseudomonadota bacterium]